MKSVIFQRGALFMLLVFGLVACQEDGSDLDEKPNSIFGDGSGDIYQAEDNSARSGCGERTNHGGYTGSGFMDYGGNETWIEWNNIDVAAAGDFDLTFRYANARTVGRQTAAIVNGQNIGNVAFAGTGSWTTWGTDTITVSLPEGLNTIRIQANTGRGGPNLDAMQVSINDLCLDDPTKTEPGNCGCGVPEGSCSGSGNGLSGTYFNNMGFTSQVLKRVDPTVDFNWGTGSPDADIDNNTFSVQWTGFVEAKFSETYTFYTSSDDGIRLWVDNELIIDNWTIHPPTENQGTISLRAGDRYEIKLDYYENGGGAVAKLLWSSSTQAKQIIPESSLFTDSVAGETLCVEVAERQSATLSCPAGETITSIDFASYGLPTGSCDTGFEIGTCQAASSMSKVEGACLNQQSCTVTASNSVFGDPCHGTFKKLAVVYACSGGVVGDKKVKVFILAGQSNMQGKGVVSYDHPASYNGGKGNLEYVMANSPLRAMYSHLKDDAGTWVVRDDVWVRHVRPEGQVMKGGLTIGYTNFGGQSHIGPELQIGHVLGDHFDEQVLLIKTAWGGAALYPQEGNSFHPPSSGGQVGNRYLQMLDEVEQALDNIETDFPGYQGQGYEIAGLVWFQGWNDMFGQTSLDDYETNLTNLIKDVRQAWNVPDLPVVIGETGNDGNNAGASMLRLRAAQAAVADHAEWGGTVAFVPTTDFARPAEDSPNTSHGHHWYGNAESYFLIGHALGQGMSSLMNGGTGGLDPLAHGLKNTLLVTMPLDATASWEEMAFLAAVPAGMKVNNGSPSVIAVQPGLFGQPDREYYDNYLDRYNADYIYNIGQPSGLENAVQLASSSLDEVTCELARFWRTSNTVVMVNRNNYKLSLSASALAGRLVAPLFYFNNQGVPNETKTCLANLGVKKVVAVGGATSVVSALQSAGIQVESIPDDRGVISWLKADGYSVDYFAVCNSGDRSHGYAPKSSLAAPLLAAARGGAVVPLNYPDSVFNDGCLIDNTTTTRPPGSAASADGSWRTGVCTVDGIAYDAVLSLQWADFGHNQGNIDLNDDGDFGGAGEFIKRGQIRQFEGREYFIDINPRRLSGHFNKHWADILFTYPTPDQLKVDIQRYHDALSHHPKYMVMVGLPDTLPVWLFVDTNGRAVTHFGDQFYANVDNDPNFEIAMGRFVGEDASIFTLAASRAITYDHLLDGAWNNRAVAYGNFEADSEMHQTMLSDAGFSADRIPKWDEIDRTAYAIGVHDDHGWPFGFEPFSSGPVPPLFASTGGCSMGNIIDMIPVNFGDGSRISEYKDFGAVRLARTGAVGFNAFAKNATANFDYVRDDYLDALLYDGATLGEAHLQSVNEALGRFHETSENVTAPMSYGDPALRIYVPGV